MFTLYHNRAIQQSFTSDVIHQSETVCHLGSIRKEELKKNVLNVEPYSVEVNILNVSPETFHVCCLKKKLSMISQNAVGLQKTEDDNPSHSSRTTTVGSSLLSLPLLPSITPGLFH